MKSILSLLILTILLSSCSKKMIQVFETSSSNTKLINSSWIFENDTTKIVYSFWSDKGIMAFSIYNKLDKPIYIDWKTSSYIYNGVKLDYWLDGFRSISTTGKTITSNSSSYKAIVSQYNGYLYTGQNIEFGEVNGSSNEISSSSSITNSVETSSSYVVHPERITFIPPKSSYSRYQFYLLPKQFEVNHQAAAVDTVTDYEDLTKKALIYKLTFDYQNSPLKFRNYLAFSFSENSQDYFFIDNEFYLTSVKEMEYRTSLGKPVGYKTYASGRNPMYGKSPYQNATSFFITY